MNHQSQVPIRHRRVGWRAALAVAAIVAPTTLLVSHHALQASEGGGEGDIVVFITADGKEETHLDHTGEAGLATGNARVEHGFLLDADGYDAGQVVTRFHYIDVRDVESNDVLIHLDCTIRLDDGSIVFGGAGDLASIPDGGESFAIWGGTGAYADASGYVTATPGELGTQLTVVLNG